MVASAWVVAAMAAAAAAVVEAAAWTGATAPEVAGRAATAASSCPEERAVVRTTRAGVAAGVCAARTGGMAWRREGGGVRQPRVAALTRGSGAVALVRRPRVPEQTLSFGGGGREREAGGGSD